MEQSPGRPFRCLDFSTAGTARTIGIEQPCSIAGTARAIGIELPSSTAGTARAIALLPHGMRT